MASECGNTVKQSSGKRPVSVIYLKNRNECCILLSKKVYLYVKTYFQL